MAKGGQTAAQGYLQVSAPAWSWRLAPYGIGTVAMHWTIERVVAFAA